MYCVVLGKALGKGVTVTLFIIYHKYQGNVVLRFECLVICQ